MAVCELSEGIIAADPAGKSNVDQDLQEVAQFVRERGKCDVVLDFASVDFLNTSHLTSLLQLQKVLTDSGSRLVFCNINRPIQGILSITGLDRVFQVAGDRPDALDLLQPAPAAP
jgi:anti-anti-sigma factor